MNTNLFSLKGKKALITGASGGLGFSIAEALASAGADIAIIGRNSHKLDEAAKRIKTATDRKVWQFAADLHETAKLKKLFDDIAAQTNGIDILVNSAGINLRGPAEDIDLETWNNVLEVNLTAVFALSQAFCRHRKDKGGGKIINIGSLMCQAARPTTTPYAASKGGLLMLTKSLAVEWAKYKINVNAIGPGYFETEMTKPLQNDEKINNWILGNIPFARWGKPQDLHGTAVFLASPASDFITGQIIYVDGGWLAAL